MNPDTGKTKFLKFLARRRNITPDLDFFNDSWSNFMELFSDNFKMKIVSKDGLTYTDGYINLEESHKFSQIRDVFQSDYPPVPLNNNIWMMPVNMDGTNYTIHEAVDELPRVIVCDEIIFNLSFMTIGNDEHETCVILNDGIQLFYDGDNQSWGVRNHVCLLKDKMEHLLKAKYVPGTAFYIREFSPV